MTGHRCARRDRSTLTCRIIGAAPHEFHASPPPDGRMRSASGRVVDARAQPGRRRLLQARLERRPRPQRLPDGGACDPGLLREAMAVRGGLGLDSYDRFFPSQDYLPVAGEGLGNLIALPLQKECRIRGTTVFVDPNTFTPFDDQWEFLWRGQAGLPSPTCSGWSPSCARSRSARTLAGSAPHCPMNRRHRRRSMPSGAGDARGTPDPRPALSR
ncbi:TOTE conflict system archaeo-eukaryotic primase domain-containing protein [Protofrankia symbiont of Coriaria ruscifolia]|uniref:TOTE conflict system archaeo-eukaryotic primase domain-containing protein n=1 Tax=Protofrankia symbiont of Coriaria ruscifolia TaxID=1306542 RepID=UPI003D6D0132